MSAMFTSSILTPVLALVAWSLIMWLWMYATRIPAMQKAKMDPQEAVRTRTLNLPGPAQWPADNYNHLMEQPTIFYAACFYVHLAGGETGLNIALAWAYVILRVLHSLVQATFNLVMLRFLIFSLATLTLFGIVGEQLYRLHAPLTGG
jgi:hypothetical protein